MIGFLCVCKTRVVQFQLPQLHPPTQASAPPSPPPLPYPSPTPRWPSVRWRSALRKLSESLSELHPNALCRPCQLQPGPLLALQPPRFMAENICVRTGSAKAVAPCPASAPEVLGPFRLFTTVCCGNGWIHGPRGSRCRGSLESK